MNPASGGEKCRQNMNMGAKSAPKTTKWGQKAPPHKSGPKKCGGKKCRQNAKVGAKSATTQIRGKKSWWLKVPSKWKNGGGKCHQSSKVMAESATTFKIRWNFNHHISNRGGTLTTTYHIQGAGAPAKTKNVNADGVYIFSGKGPTFSASCKTYKQNF